MNQIESETDYVDQHFKDVVWEAVSLQEATFEACLFTNCVFRETVFRQCLFHECTFKGCDLSLVKVDGSTFRHTVFEDCRMMGVNWTVAIWTRFAAAAPICFYKCSINYSTFIGLSLMKIRFEGCTAKDVDFSDADLTEADFSQTVLTGSHFRHTNLTGANFEEATDYLIDVTKNTVSKARFSLPEAISLLNGLDIKLRH